MILPHLRRRLQPDLRIEILCQKLEHISVGDRCAVCFAQSKHLLNDKLALWYLLVSPLPFITTEDNLSVELLI